MVWVWALGLTVVVRMLDNIYIYIFIIFRKLLMLY